MRKVWSHQKQNSSGIFVSQKTERKEYMLTGKTVLLGVTGGIAAYKSASLASLLVKAGAEVRVLMTENAKNFIHPITFEALTGHKCVSDTFDRNFEFKVEHVALAKKADAVIIAPATANVIAKIAHGIADDMLTTTVLACRCQKIVAPAMNTAMYENPVTQDNLEILRRYGMEIADPDSGYLACGDVGAGKMTEPEDLFWHVARACAFTGSRRDMEGLKVLVTSGPTQEAVDPVRYITNHSSGKMGYSIARMCMLRGAEVTLVTGKTALKAPLFVDVVPVVTAKEMYDAVVSRSEEMDIVIKAAAVADYRPRDVSEEKVKKADGPMAIELERTDDILAFLGSHKTDGQFLCGFSMETEHMVENSRKKLVKKNLDMIVANNLKVQGAGFETDTNIVTLIGKDFEEELPMMKKEQAASCILDKIMELK